MHNRDRKKLDLATTVKSKPKIPYSRPLVEEKQPVAEVEVAPQYEAPMLSEEADKIDGLVAGLKEEKEQSKSETKARPKLELSGKKAAKKEEAKPDFLDMDKDGNTEEPMEKAVAEAKPKDAQKKEVKEEVLQTHEDRILGAIDQQLATMAKLNKSDAPAPKSLTEQKIENLEGQVRDMRRMMLEMSGMQAQNTIVGGLGAGSPGSGEVKLSKLDDVDVTDLKDGNALIYNTTTSRFEASPVSNGGYEFTGGFSDRDDGQAGANDLGSVIAYPQSFVDEQRWYRFGFSQAAQTTNDIQYWGETDPNFDQTKGLFGGLHMPSGVTDLFDFSYDDGVGGYSEASDGSLKYSAATGSIDFRQARVGDLALVRFDFNVIPQVANTTLEVAMIWATRGANDNITFTFPLTGSPLFYGTGTVGRTFLTRPLLTAYFASQEDVNARALLAIRADNPIQIAPLTTLVTLQR
ncbi:hypothetical protein [Synechococcus phage MA01]